VTTAKRTIEIEDLYRLVDVEDVNLSPDERWIAYVQFSLDKPSNGYKRQIWLARTDGQKLIQLTQGTADSQPRWSPDSTTLAFTAVRGDKPQIHAIRITEPGGEAYRLTNQPNGANNPAWSPDGKQIAFLSSMDAEERAAEDRGVVSTAPENPLEAKHQKELQRKIEDERYDPHIAWRIPYRDGYGTTFADGRYKQIYVIAADQASAQARRLTDIDADHSMPVWTRDGQYLLTYYPSDYLTDEPSRFDCLHRIQVSNGAVERLTNEAYADRLPAISPDGAWIAFNRVPHEKQYTRVPFLALVASDGSGARALTETMDRTAVECKWSPDSALIYFRAHSEGSTSIYSVTADGATIAKVVTSDSFIEVQNFDVGRKGGIAFIASSPEQPAEVFYLPSGATTPVQLSRVNQLFLDDVQVQPTHELRYLNPNGDSIQGWYILPPDYQAGQTYPLITYIHGGPRIMLNPAAKVWHEWQTFAARGYVVFYCNAHGSDGYGYQYQRLSYGDPDFPDHMAGIDRMIEMGLADPSRLAVSGGSYGGYMTAWVVGHTDRFAAAVAERGVYNLVSQYGTSDFPIPTVHEFDVNPWEDPMLLWKYSPLAYAHQIKTPLLLIHSERDYRVAISEAEQLFAFVRLSGGTVRFVRFPREGHGLSRTGEPEHRVKRLKHILEWFDDHCSVK